MHPRRHSREGFCRDFGQHAVRLQASTRPASVTSSYGVSPVIHHFCHSREGGNPGRRSVSGTATPVVLRRDKPGLAPAGHFLSLLRQRKEAKKGDPQSTPASQVPKRGSTETGSEINSPAAQTNFASLSVSALPLLASPEGGTSKTHPHPGPPLREGTVLFITLRSQFETYQLGLCLILPAAAR
jgi:hypothetical protein